MKKLVFVLLFLCSTQCFSQSATITLTATATVDSKATIASYQWSESSGAAQAGYSDSTHNILIANFIVPGNYVFHCVITDNKNQQASSDSYVTIIPYSYNKPTVVITPTSTPTNPIQINLK